MSEAAPEERGRAVKEKPLEPFSISMIIKRITIHIINAIISSIITIIVLLLLLVIVIIIIIIILFGVRPCARALARCITCRNAHMAWEGRVLDFCRLLFVCF